MRKIIVGAVDIILFVAFAIALFAGWMHSQLIGLIVVFVGGALVGGAWAALSLLLDHVESIKRQSANQTDLLKSIRDSLEPAREEESHTYGREVGIQGEYRTP
jgi:hypothetical protein